MKPNHTKTYIIINYILLPLYALLMFRIMFFEDSDSFLEKIIANKSNPMMYLAILLSILTSLCLRWGTKFPKQTN